MLLERGVELAFTSANIFTCILILLNLCDFSLVFVVVVVVVSKLNNAMHFLMMCLT